MVRIKNTDKNKKLSLESKSSAAVYKNLCCSRYLSLFFLSVTWFFLALGDSRTTLYYFSIFLLGFQPKGHQ